MSTKTVIALALAAMMPAAVFASAIPTTAALVVVDAERNGETGQFAALFPANTIISGAYNWSLEQPVTIASTSSGAVLGTLDTLDLVFNADPAVVLNFSVVAGPFGTNFTITSAIIQFAPIANPDAYASAAITVTDNNLNGATLTGLLANSKAYRAYYNNPAVDWAYLVGPVVAPAGASAVGSERRPALPQIWETIPATVDQIGSQFRFHLTALDSASGTSRFEVVPEPVSLSLLALGGLAMLRRRP